MTRTVDEILETAADLISRHGWTQHQMFDNEGRMCAVGAIYRASGLYNSECEYFPNGPAESSDLADGARDALSIQTTGHSEMGGSSVPRWNDRRERTAEDVVLAFKHAADNFRNGRPA